MNKSYDACVVDIETLGTSPNAVITNVGGVLFNYDDEETEEFYRRLSWADDQENRTIDPSTVQWWLQQSYEARFEVLTETERVTLPQCISDLQDIVERTQDHWAKPPSFDFSILCNSGLLMPDFRSQFDVRTLICQSPSLDTIPFEGTKHHALHDARHEAKVVRTAMGRRLAS